MNPRRDATREDRWEVRPTLNGRKWYAQPVGAHVFADLGRRRKGLVFKTWTEAMAYVTRRVYGK
ncbi:hypothetical protein [Marisediminicola senii]|uniref:hypothetical protein n=1 Tax=Marisediminicola senii TaxID=2711233 RepID=UPI0013EE2C51|nr:hypothetical protein [Marisediminicola senii]